MPNQLQQASAAFQPSAMGRYNAIATLGQGGMANIYLALMTGPARFSKLLVLKVLREDLETDRKELVDMFLDEARLAARLQHRNIVQTYEFGEIQGTYYMAMEYLEGKTLRELHRKAGPLPSAEELHVLAEIARGIDYAHELVGLRGESLSVVHRDLSPQNIFITYDGQVKLLDFGIAKVEGADHLTQVGFIKGKIDYMAPEQVRSERLDRRADVFALGVMLWEAVTHERFAGGIKVPHVTKFHNRITGSERKVRELKPDVPEALASIIDEALALDPRDRMPSAAMFADRLEAYLATLAQQPNGESLADVMDRAFSEERTELRKLIEEQCTKILEHTPTNSGANKLDLRLAPASALDLSTHGTGSNTRDPSVALPTLHAKAAKQKLALVGGLASVGTAALLLFLGGALHREPAADAPAERLLPAAPAAAAPALAPAPPPHTSSAERSVTIGVDATPAGALALLDGVPLPGLPFSGSFPTSGALHSLEVSAKGYETVRRFVSFERNQEINIRLQALGRPARAGQRRGAVEPGGTAPAVAANPNPAPAQEQPRAEQPAPGATLKANSRTRGFEMQDPYAE